MALDNVPKTNYTVNDGVIADDLNNIGLNLLELEDSKYESGDDITAGDITAGDITAGDITAGDITAGDITLSGVINPTTAPTSDTEVVSSSSSWIIPRGIYNISLPTTPISSSVSLEIFVDGSWRPIAVRASTASEQESYGSSVFSDGTNTRVNNLDSISYTVYYQKF